MIDFFILSSDSRRPAVEDLDFEKQTIFAPESPIPFSASSKYIASQESGDPSKDSSTGSDQASLIDQIRNSPKRKRVLEAMLAFLKSQNRRGSKTKMIERLDKLLAEIEAEEGGKSS